MSVGSAVVDQRSSLRVRGGFPFARGADRNAASGLDEDGNTDQIKGHRGKNAKRRSGAAILACVAPRSVQIDPPFSYTFAPLAIHRSLAYHCSHRTPFC